MQYQNPKVEFKEVNNKINMSLEFDIIGDKKAHCIIPNIDFNSIVLESKGLITQTSLFKSYEPSKLLFNVNVTSDGEYCKIDIID